jgi:DNA-binding response OmpR family regulator
MKESSLRILVVEDDLEIASFVIKGLKMEGFAVDHAVNGENGLQMATVKLYNAAIVDVMLPVMDGLGLIEELRRQMNHIPVIILSAKRSLEDRVKGLQRGSDDYLTKPFAFSELLARLHALLRRSSGSREPTRFTVGGITIDLLIREVFREGKKIELQPREFSLLGYLMRNAGQVVSKTMIMEQVFEYSFNPQTNVVDVLVCRLRNKLDKDFEEKVIQTIRGVGYEFRIS